MTITVAEMTTRAIFRYIFNQREIREERLSGGTRHAENRDCESRLLTVGSERVLISGSRSNVSSASTARSFSFQ
jgi:hypothetical protein